jgi:hypothetical protein
LKKPERRRDSLTATIRRIDNIGYAILFYLAATVLPLHFPISASGFSLPNSKNAREPLLIVWFSLHYYETLKNREQTYSEALLECLLEKRAGNDTVALATMMLRYGIEPEPFQLQTQAQPGVFRLLLLLGFLFLHLGWQITIMGIGAIV